MKALAISQPWAELIIAGKKRIEIRTKNTAHRGWFYIYSAKKDTKEEVIEKFGYHELPTGAVLGKAYLKSVKRYKNPEEFYRDEDLHLASKEDIELEGWKDRPKYGYVISKVERLTPVRARGMPGFFDLTFKRPSPKA